MSHTVVFRGAFFRYLLTYMIYLLVLLAVMAAYYRHNMRSWQNNELELYATALTDKVTEYQKQLSYIESLGQRIELDTRYRSLYRQKADWDNADYVGISAIQRDFSYTMLPYLPVSYTHLNVFDCLRHIQAQLLSPVRAVSQPVAADISCAV